MTAYSVGILANSYKVNLLANCMIATGISMNYSLLIVLINESLPNSSRKKISVILFIVEVTGYIAFTFMEMF